MPKLKASYFVDVRPPGQKSGATISTAPAHGSTSNLLSPTSTIDELAANARPFEEIKRMRLCQALDTKPGEGGFNGLTPSPTYSTSGRTSFETSFLTPRFSPGKGVKVFASTSTVNNSRQAFGSGGLRDGDLLSPSLTEPPTPPSRREWKQVSEAEKCAPKPMVEGGHCQSGASESDQDVLPMEQRPLDEVNAVQALMSVGRGTRAQPDQASDSTSSIADESGTVHMTDVSYFRVA